jgi:eukaryotic-like serine/threonine-protein kinase
VSETSGGRAQGRIGSVINGKWQIDARIGAGGMATVYAATHRNGGRAALKLLHATLSRDEAVRARFLREGYLANQVAHPGVCAVLDDGYTDDGCAFLVLELLEGETVEARRLRSGGRLPVDEAMNVAEQALAALAAAHEKSIVHRDVKPENIFITTTGQVKLLDFGLARMRDAHTEATATGVTIGTPEFMPPEQALGKGDLVDARSDVWGLGASLFTMLSGDYVHHANTLHEQLIASATRRARSVLDVAPDVPPAIAQVIAKALELERSDRWSSAGEMQQALRAARAAPGGTAIALPYPSSGRTMQMDPPTSSEPPTIDARRFDATAAAAMGPMSAAPYTPHPQTERLSGPPQALGQVTMHMRPHVPSSNPMLAPPSHLSSGQMPSVPPPQHVIPLHQHNGSSGSYPFVQLPPQAPQQQQPHQRRGSSRAALIATLIMLVIVLVASAWVYAHGVPRVR